MKRSRYDLRQNVTLEKTSFPFQQRDTTFFIIILFLVNAIYLLSASCVSLTQQGKFVFCLIGCF